MPSTKPFPTILHEWTEVIARQNMREFKRFMDEADLSPSQINALFRLHFGGMCGISEIAGHLGVTDPAASQMVERLVQRDMVARTEDPSDRRMKLLALTANGHEKIEKTIANRRQWMERLTHEFNQDQQEMIASALEMLIEAAKRLENKTPAEMPQHEPANQSAEPIDASER
jgi:DNA-binding MarR family transcriptional regulator